MLQHYSSFHSSSSKKAKRPSAHQSSQVNPFNSQQIQTVSGQLSSKLLIESHVLFCSKHNQKPIEKICLHPSCEQEMLFCTECYYDSQNHVSNHRDNIFSYAEFIKICKDKSLNHQDSLPQDKSFNLIIADLENNVVKYKTHIRREEEKIDEDFDALIESVTADINDLRSKLKEKLKTHSDSYFTLCTQLKEETTSMNKESSSNHKLNNEYDSFLINLTSQKNSSCNFKRLITNLKPHILKQLLGEVTKPILGASNWQSANSKLELTVIKELVGPSQINNILNGSVMNTQQLSGSSIASLGEKGANKFAKGLKDAFNEFQYLTTYKPLYRNQGEANNIYRQYLSESRKQYFIFLEGLAQFVALQTNPAAQSNGQFATNVMGQFSNIQNTNATVSSSYFGVSSPTNSGKLSVSSSGKKANALRGSLTNFNSLYSNLAVQVGEMNNQANNEDVISIQNQAFNAQSVRLSDKQRISTIDHLNTLSTGHSKGIVALKVIDSETIVTASSDKTIRFFKNHKEVKEIQFESDVTSLGTLGQGTPQQILVGLFQSFAVISLLDYTLIKTISCAHESSINQLVGLSDGQTVITASSDPKLITFNLFNSEIMNPKKYFEHRDSIYCLEVFPNNKFVASGGKDRSIKVWKLNFYSNFRMNALEKLTIESNFENAHSCDVTALRACVTYDNILISGGANGDIKIWDILLGKALRSIKNTSGWVFGIITLERPHLASAGNENKRSIVDSWKENTESYSSPKKSAVVSPKKQITSLSYTKSSEKFSSPVHSNKRLTKTQIDQLGNISILTASFDGSIKIWEATKDISTVVSKSKNVFDCYPFGGLATYNTDNTIHLVTSGNKGDTNLNIYALN